MSFISFFRSQIPDILTRLKTNRLELNKIQYEIERLFILEQNYASEDLTEDQYNFCIKTAIDMFGVALWIKDQDSRFLFANKVCCEEILKCTEEEALNLTDTDFEKDVLAVECIKSDKLVMKNNKTMRFIEHAVYSAGKEIFVDIVKSPRVEHGEIVGTIGSGIIITDSIPVGIRNQHRLSHSIEIPLKSSMGTKKLINLLERRKQGDRDDKSSKKFQDWRKEMDLDVEKG